MSDADLGPRELARLTGVSTDTLRHYERKGLLPPPRRTAAGYRRYSPESARRVNLIQRALAIGFSLDELARVLRERDRGGAPCRSVRALVGQRLEALDQQLAALTTLRAELQQLLIEWDERLAGTADGARAHLLETFTGRAGIENARTRRRLTRRPLQ